MMNIRSDKGDQAFTDRLDTAMSRMDRDDMVADIFHAPVRTQTGTSAQDIIIETDKLDAAYIILFF